MYHPSLAISTTFAMAHCMNNNTGSPCSDPGLIKTNQGYHL